MSREFSRAVIVGNPVEPDRVAQDARIGVFGGEQKRGYAFLTGVVDGYRISERQKPPVADGMSAHLPECGLLITSIAAPDVLQCVVLGELDEERREQRAVGKVLRIDAG